MTLFWDAAVYDGLFNFPNLIIVGDLNFTLLDVEIWGRNSHLEPICTYFFHLLASTNIIDVAPTCIGPTWINDRLGGSGIKKRLDRILIFDSRVPLFSRYRS